MALPQGFVDLATAYESRNSTFVNIIGITVDLLPPKLGKRDEYMMTFKLLDQCLHDAVRGQQGLTVRFFRKDLQRLPPVRRLGDVVLVRNAKMINFNEQPIAISNIQTTFLVFPAESIPDPNFEIAFQGQSRRIPCLGIPQDVARLSLGEQSYVVKVKHEMAERIAERQATEQPRPVSNFNAPTEPAAMRKRPGHALVEGTAKRPRTTFGDKFQLISELRHYVFADICAQVVRKFPKYGDCELYVTDYTENKDMFYYTPPEEDEANLEKDGDMYGYADPKRKSWPGPYGFMVLKVNLKTPHASFAIENVHEDDFILLRNVKMKVMPDGSKLEGDMWPDKQTPDRVKISKLKNHQMSEIQAVLSRKDKYWAAREAKLGKVGMGGRPAPKVTRTGRKRNKKKQDGKLKARSDGQESLMLRPDADQEESARQANGRVVTNSHVRCSNSEIPSTSIRHILDPDNERHTNRAPTGGPQYDLPFINAKYRTRVRVVDFAPKELADFSIPRPINPEADISQDPMISPEYGPLPQYDWSFSLLLEDASSTRSANNADNRLWAHLSHEDAQYLLGNDMVDPVDLSSRGEVINKLREKLCILWGNLEEKAEEEAVSNLPFECCLMEFGVPPLNVDMGKEEDVFGFERHYSMFGVTIL